SANISSNDKAAIGRKRTPAPRDKSPARSRSRKGCDWSTVQEIARALPEADEGMSYGTPAFFVKKKLFVRLHQSRESVVIMIPIGAREGLMQTDPETFYITDHYACYPAMLVRLSTVRFEVLRSLVEESWRSRAP